MLETLQHKQKTSAYRVKTVPPNLIKYYKLAGVFLHWVIIWPVAFVIGFSIVVILCCINFPQWQRAILSGYERVN